MGIVITHFTEEGMWLKLINVYNVLGFPDEVCSCVAEYSDFWGLACVCACGVQRLAPAEGIVKYSLKNKISWHLYKCN